MHLSSHIRLGRMLLENSSIQHRPLHRTAFLFGSIRPDIFGSFLLKKHTPNKRYDRVLYMIEKIVANAVSGKRRTFVSSIRLGVICHFLADFFCYPHNEGYCDGSVVHYKYETALYEYIKNPTATLAIDDVPSAHYPDVAAQIAALHRQYLAEMQSDLSRDASYIIAVCTYLFESFELAVLQSHGFGILAHAE